MRNFPEELNARLQSGVTTTCLCWRLTRVDGEMVALTEHDRAIIFDGETYAPQGVISAGAFTQSAALKPGQASGGGALQSDALSEEDIEAGLWDGARVDVFRVDWCKPELRWAVWSGRLSEIRHGALGFEAELVSLKADLERPVGRLYTRQCDAVLGDARCGLDAQTLPPDARCDGRWATCRDTYQNTDNFRGFPHMPGNDFILAGPASRDNDGRAR